MEKMLYKEMRNESGEIRIFLILPFLLQMSKSTGNFLTLTEAIDKFSADGRSNQEIIECTFIKF